MFQSFFQPDPALPFLLDSGLFKIIQEAEKYTLWKENIQVTGNNTMKLNCFSSSLLASFLFFGCSGRAIYDVTTDMQREKCYQLHESEQEKCFDRIENTPSYEIYKKERESLIHKTP